MRRSLALPVAVAPLVATLLSVVPATAQAPGDGAAAAARPTAAGESLPAGAEPARRRRPVREVAHQQWDTGAELRSGRLRGTVVRRGSLVLGQPVRTRRLDGTRYDAAHWTSPWVRPGFALTELIGSWSARTPGDSWIEVTVRGRDAEGTRSSWDSLGRWAAGDRHVQRTSVAGQGDDLADVAVDTWRTTSSAGLTRWQLRVTLLRRSDATTRPPRVTALGAMASRLPDVDDVPTSRPGVASGAPVLEVPSYSQMVHEGHYPQWGNGGEAWCSPTSTSMVLGYYDRLPRRRDQRFVPAGHPDPWVDAAARATYDAGYRGTGNWSFNTAFAATRTGKAFVTRLRSLREAERFVAVGIPLVVSVAFGPGELSGAPISSTAGHLMVIVGFTADGDVVVNDPAADSNPGVRRTYDRGQFEDVWLPTSGGLTYVIHDREHQLPPGGRGAW